MDTLAILLRVARDRRSTAAAVPYEFWRSSVDILALIWCWVRERCSTAATAPDGFGDGQLTLLRSCSSLFVSAAAQQLLLHMDFGDS